MAKYGVAVSQTINYYFEVDANNEDEAYEAYNNLVRGDISWNDYECGSEFEVLDIEEITAQDLDTVGAKD